ncbi:MAG: tRNA-dihydrouridine synthase family protein [Planctomycetota bacterium]|nr:tRNA-dihydrouridine synthase family protein [Planctomycetota bacterium]
MNPAATKGAPAPAAPVVEGLPFTSRWLLAPMEGVTAPSFRDIVLARHAPTDLGGAFTEFVRVIDRPVAKREMHKHLGPRRFSIPVGIQLMGSDLGCLTGSAAHAAELGVPVLDLNFGCPARGALKGCAGAAALKNPSGVEATVRAAVEGVDGRTPVTAKIRAGFDHDRDVEVLARAAEAGGASMLTIHCRTRREGYQEEVHWSRIRRAVEAVSIPVAGNGSAWLHSDLERMRQETGCAFVMVGRGALRDPWIFSGRDVPLTEAAAFLHEYACVLQSLGAPRRAAVGRVKQLLKYWEAGRLVGDAEGRERWLRDRDTEGFLGRLESLAPADVS